jgi:magnesium transporter
MPGQTTLINVRGGSRRAILKEMINSYHSKKLTWIDVELPTQAEIKNLMETYGLDPDVGQDLISPNLRPKIELYDTYIHLILQFPAYKHSHKKGGSQEIDFIMGRDFLITVRYDSNDPIHAFSKIFETNSILEKENAGDHAGYIFFHMITKLYKSLFHELEYIQDSLNEIETRIFGGEEKKVVRELSMVSREIINLKQVLHSHEEILKLFHNAAVRMYGEPFGYYCDLIFREYQKTLSETQNKKEFLIELRETNDSLLNTRQNEIMKNLTLMAFFTIPLSLLVSIFSLATDYPVITGSRYDFGIILAILGGVLLVMIAYFYHKKWL